MTQLFRLSNTVRRDPAIEAWMREHADALGALAQRPEHDVDAKALVTLIETAYTDMKGRLAMTFPASRTHGESDANR